jgi:histidyl-tRNA synthetase
MRVGAEHASGLMVADLKVARGLDYYTGTVYETQLIGSESYGSICSGGRYDALAADGKTTYPGVGISIGLSRLLARIMPTLSASRATPSCVLVALADESDRAHGMDVAAALRRRGIACEVAPVAAKFGKQIMFAQRRGIPFVWFSAAGEQSDEPDKSPGKSSDHNPDKSPGRSPGRDSVKDIRSGAQAEADAASWMPPAEDLRPRVLA